MNGCSVYDRQEPAGGIDQACAKPRTICFNRSRTPVGPTPRPATPRPTAPRADTRTGHPERCRDGSPAPSPGVVEIGRQKWDGAGGGSPYRKMGEEIRKRRTGALAHANIPKPLTQGVDAHLLTLVSTNWGGVVSTQRCRKATSTSRNVVSTQRCRKATPAHAAVLCPCHMPPSYVPVICSWHGPPMQSTSLARSLLRQEACHTCWHDPCFT